MSSAMVRARNVAPFRHKKATTSRHAALDSTEFFTILELS
jgi:hypothetical protein